MSLHIILGVIRPDTPSPLDRNVTAWRHKNNKQDIPGRVTARTSVCDSGEWQHKQGSTHAGGCSPHSSAWSALHLGLSKVWVKGHVLSWVYILAVLLQSCAYASSLLSSSSLSLTFSFFSQGPLSSWRFAAVLLFTFILSSTPRIHLQLGHTPCH